MSDTSPLTAAECADRLRTLSTGLQALFGPIDTGMVIDAASHLDRLAAVERELTDAHLQSLGSAKKVLELLKQHGALTDAAGVLPNLAAVRAVLSTIVATPSGDRPPEPEQGT